MPRTSERWTEKLTKIECSRRHWAYVPTSWTLRFPARNGNGFLTRRVDLLGFADAFGIPEDGGAVLIQFTEDSAVSNRVNKIRAHINLWIAERAGWRIVVWGWRKKDARLREVVVREGTK